MARASQTRLISVLYAAVRAVFWGDGVKATLLVPLVLAAVAVAAATDGSAGIPVWMELREDLADAQARVSALEAETEALRIEIAALADEPFALERAIREDLVLALPGEVIVRFRKDSRSGW